jgi:hypothetical protein
MSDAPGPDLAFDIPELFISGSMDYDFEQVE